MFWRREEMFMLTPFIAFLLCANVAHIRTEAPLLFELDGDGALKRINLQSHKRSPRSTRDDYRHSRPSASITNANANPVPADPAGNVTEDLDLSGHQDRLTSNLTENVPAGLNKRLTHTASNLTKENQASPADRPRDISPNNTTDEQQKDFVSPRKIAAVNESEQVTNAVRKELNDDLPESPQTLERPTNASLINKGRTGAVNLARNESELYDEVEHIGIDLLFVIDRSIADHFLQTAKGDAYVSYYAIQRYFGMIFKEVQRIFARIQMFDKTFEIYPMGVVNVKELTKYSMENSLAHKNSDG